MRRIYGSTFEVCALKYVLFPERKIDWFHVLDTNIYFILIYYKK